MTTGSTRAREGIRLRCFGRRAHIAVSARGGEGLATERYRESPLPAADSFIYRISGVSSTAWIVCRVCKFNYRPSR
jgi:hypothetical protein